MLAKGFCPLTPGTAARAIGVALALGLLGGCAISEAVHVRKGITPQYADDNVRFRTTYYFRSVDFCEQIDPEKDANLTFGNRLPAPAEQVFIRKNKIDRIVKDTLYRFTMTGKASPLTKVQFESGTLKSWQIDPFGASVAFDKENNRFYWKSQDATQADARISEIVEDVERLAVLRDRLEKTDKAGAEAVGTLIVRRLETLGGNYGDGNGASLTLSVAAGLRKISNTEVNETRHLADAYKMDATKYPGPPKALDINPGAQRAQVIAELETLIAAVKLDTAHLEELHKKTAALAGAVAPLNATMTEMNAKAKSLAEELAKAAPDKNAAVTLVGEIDTLQKKGVTELATAVSEAGKIDAASGPAKAITDTKTEFDKIAALVTPADTAIKAGIDDAAKQAATALVDAIKTAAGKSAATAETASKNHGDVAAALAKSKAVATSLGTQKDQASGASVAAAGPEQTGECAPGARFGRGFQLIGPEGVQTFNQEDRLIMAMSSSATPILSALSELSGRMLRQEAGRSDRLLPLVQEQVRISKAEQSLPLIEAKPASELKGAVEDIVKQLEAGGLP